MKTPLTRGGALATISALALSLVPGGAAAQAPPPDGWQVEEAAQRLPLTIQASDLGAPVQDFPVLVTLPADSVRDAERDALVFTTTDSANPLPYEVEHWDEGGDSAVWVKVPEVGPEPETLHLYFDGAPENTTDPAEVWDDAFEVVTHMATDAAPVPDSTGNGHTLEAAGDPAFAQTTDSATLAIELGHNEHLQYPGGENGVGNRVEHMTIATTVYLPEAITSATSPENHIVSRDYSPNLFPEDQLAFFAHNGQVRPRINAGGTWSDTPYSPLGGPGWYDFAVTYDEERLKVYVNGELTQDSPLTGQLHQGSTYPLRLGRIANSAYEAKAGQVYDEFRMSDVARSADWIRAEHLARTGELVAVGAPETVDGTVRLHLDVTAPEPDARLTGDVPLSGTVNQPAEVSYVVDDGEAVSLGEVTGDFTTTIAGLDDGEHTVVVTAAVDGQDPVSTTVTFVVDTAGPDVTIVSPVDGASYDELGFAIDVDAEDPDGVARLDLLLDGEPVRNDRRIVPATAGEHTLEVTAVDELGHTTTQTVTFTSAGPGEDRGPWAVPEAEQRLPVTVRGEGLSEPVEDFPVLVQLGTDDVDYSTIDPDHLVFTAAGSEEPLPYEVESWDVDGVSSLWVRAPEVSAEPSRLHLYYDGAPANETDPTAVWDEGFEVVTHMAEPGEDGALPDSTGNGHPLTERGDTTAGFGQDTASGTPGVTFDGGEALEYTTGPGADVEQITLTTTVHLAPEHVAADSLENYIAAREKSGFPSGDQFTFLLHQGTLHPRLTIDGQWSYTDRVAVDAGWHTLSFSYDTERLVMFIDGVKVQDWAKPGELRQGSDFPLRLGELSEGRYPAKPGYVYDEFRLSNVARSESWLRAEHLAATGRLSTVGPVEQSTEDAELALEITTPEADGLVSATPEIRGQVSRTATIDYRLDGGEWTAAGRHLGAFSVPVGELAGGEHTLEVRATAGEETDAVTLSFVVDDVLPEIDFVSPTEGATYGTDGIDVHVDATDDSGITSLELRLDGMPVENKSHVAPEDMVGDEHVLEATAVDSAGNTRTESVSFVAVGTAAPDSWLVPEASKRLPYVVEADVSSTVTGFPALVQFDDRMVDYSTIDPDHIVFTTADDPTPLPYDVERWYSSARLSSIWVRLPEVSAEPQTIYMYFDGVPENETDPTDVWDDAYEVVSHMEYETSPQRDVTGNGHVIAQVGQQGYRASAENRTPAVQFDNTPGMQIEGGAHTPGANAANLMLSTTVSIPESLLGDEDDGRHTLLARGVPGGTGANDQLGLYVEGEALWATLRLDRSWGSVTAPIEAGWHTIHVTYDGSLLRLYVDGELEASQHFGQTIRQGSTAPLMLGSLEDGTQDAVGIIVDEVRVSSSARNADWALLEYLSAGTELTTPGGMETSDSAPALFLGLPAPSEAYGPGLLSVTGTTWEPLELSYVLNDEEPVSLGEVLGDFGTTIEGLPDGEHTIVLTGTRPSGRTATKTATFTVDGVGPAIEFVTPVQDGHHDESFVLDVDVADERGVDSLTLTIDGREVENGEEIDLVDLVGLEHELVAVATDGVGNESRESITFTAPGAIPAVPVDPQPDDGATQVDPTDASLSVVASDASGDPLDVTFHWTYVSGADEVHEGSTRNGEPTVDAGEPAVVAELEDGGLTTQADGAYPFQRFEVHVPESVGAEEVEVAWTGGVALGDRAQLSAWNHDEEEWVELTAGTGDPVTLTAEVPVEGFVVDETATLLVQNRPAAILDDDSLTRFLWLTDTQRYSAGDHAETYLEMTQWAVDNREEKDISYAIHTGDIVDNAYVESQWQVADAAHRIWDEAGFPYGVLPGNHDVNTSYSDFTSYHQWFPASRFEDNPWYGGSSRNNADHYDVVSTPEADYLVLYLGTALTPTVFAWANDVIESHPDHNVIIAVHHILTMYGGHDYEYQAKQIYDELIVPNDNVGMMIGGHHCSPMTRTQEPSEGRTVYEVMMDPQCNPNGGDGWMRFIDFDIESSTMEQSTFSIKKEGNQYWPEGQPNSGGPLELTEHENFTGHYDLQRASRSLETESFTVSALASAPIQGETVTVGSGERATLELAGLEEDTEYFWYASSTNERGYTSISPVWSFTTGTTATQPTDPEEPTEEPTDPEEPGEPQPDTRTAEFHLSNTWRATTDRYLMYGKYADEVLIGDWDGDGRDSIAVRRGNEFHVSNDQRGGAPDVVFRYGRPDDVILVGDWDGDGTETFAVRRGAQYHVKNALRGGDADVVVTYGRSGDRVLVGDWDGDGVDTFAVRRGAEYHVKNALRGGDADVVFQYGRTGDVTHAGDWDGDGVDTFMVQRGRTFYVNDSLRGGDADRVVTFGRPGDEVYVGDWDGNGTDTLGVRRPVGAAATTKGVGMLGKAG